MGVLVLGLGGAFLVSPAQAQSTGDPSSPPEAWVRVADKASILRDGTVRIRLWSKCPSTYQPFELSVSVTQRDAVGYVTRMRPPDVVICDDTVHRTIVRVPPETGTFHRGWAKVFANIQFYDTEAGSDTEASTERIVRLWQRA